MRKSITARIFGLLTLVLVVTIGSTYWKARQLFDHQQKRLFEEQNAKISAEVGHLASDRVKYVHDELIRFVSGHEANPKIKEVPRGWWGSFLFVATMEKTAQGWTPKWMEWGPQSPVQQWPTGAVIRLLEDIQWDMAKEQAQYFQKVNDPSKQPLFAFVSTIPRIDPVSGAKRVAIGVLSPVALTDLVSNYKGGFSTVAIIDRQGVAFSHSSSALTGSSLEKNPAVRDLMTQGELTRSEYAKPDILASLEPVSGTNLFTLTTTPMSVVTKAQQPLFISFLTIGLGLLLLAGAAALHFSRWYASPLQRLNEFVRTIGTGTEPDLEGPSFKEVDELISSVTQMRIHILNHVEDENRRRQRVGESERHLLLKSLSSSLGQEMKNPLIGILGHSQLAKDKVAGRDDLKKHFEAIEKEARKTKNLVDNLLKFSGSEKVDFSSTNFYDIVASSLAQVEPFLQAKGIKVNKHLSAVPRVIGNAGQLRQSIVALLLHQGKTMERTLTKELSVYLECVESKIMLRIEDTGEGLSSDYQQTAFEPNPGNISDPTFELAAIHGVIESHQGTLQLSSTIGHGNIFSVVMGIDQQSQPTNQIKIEKPKLSEMIVRQSPPNVEPILEIDDLSEIGQTPPLQHQARMSEELKAETSVENSLSLSMKDMAFLESVTTPNKKIGPTPSDFFPDQFSVDLPSAPPDLMKDESFKVVVRKPRMKV